MSKSDIVLVAFLLFIAYMCVLSVLDARGALKEHHQWQDTKNYNQSYERMLRRSERNRRNLGWPW